MIIASNAPVTRSDEAPLGLETATSTYNYIKAAVRDKEDAISGSTNLSLFSLIVTEILSTIHTHRSRVVILSGEGLNLYKNPRVNLSA